MKVLREKRKGFQGLSYNLYRCLPFVCIWKCVSFFCSEQNIFIQHSKKAYGVLMARNMYTEVVINFHRPVTFFNAHEFPCHQTWKLKCSGSLFVCFLSCVVKRKQTNKHTTIVYERPRDKKNSNWNLVHINLKFTNHRRFR